MKRPVVTAVTICLVLVVAWFLFRSDEKQGPSQSTTKSTPPTPTASVPASTSTAKAQPSESKPTSQTPTAVTATAKTIIKPPAWASAAKVSKPGHDARMPGEGLPAATQEQVRALTEQASDLEDKGDLPGAIDANKKAFKLDPWSTRIANTLAGLYGKQADYRSEADWARKSLELDPQYTAAYVNLGNAMGAAGRPAEARKAFRRVMELDPKNPLGVYSLGVVAENQFRYRMAAAYYEQSTRLDPKFQDGYYNAAAMHANLKEYDAAIANLDKLRQLKPNDEDANQLLADVIARKAIAQIKAEARKQQQFAHKGGVQPKRHSRHYRHRHGRTRAA